VPSADQPDLTVLYDADCGFCQLCATAIGKLDGAGRVAFVPLQQAARVMPSAPPVKHLLEVMHVVDDRGRWSEGGAAWINIFERVPLLRPLALAARLPLLNRLVEPLYALIARNRHQIGRLARAGACDYRPDA
jgi:predicted DCC family thiol-disulfide oxidoreductase YuxK